MTSRLESRLASLEQKAMPEQHPRVMWKPHDLTEQEDRAWTVKYLDPLGDEERRAVILVSWEGKSGAVDENSS